MGTVMMDNLGLDAAIRHLMDPAREISDQVWINFLTAIVLWDEIWYLDSPEYTNPWLRKLGEDSRLASLCSILFPVDDVLIDTYDQQISDDWLNSITYPEMHSLDARMTRTPLYIILSNLLGVNILLHPSRAQESRIEILDQFFTRLDIFSRVDWELFAYYTSINEKMHRAMWKFEYPVLFDYIRKNTCSREEELQAAVALRENKDLIAFKELITDIEQKVNDGDTQLLLTQLDIVSNAAREITTKYNRKMDLGELKLSLKPSLSKTIPIKVRCHRDLKIHTAFISKLLEFGVSKRPRDRLVTF